jgi:hypothetical protein
MGKLFLFGRTQPPPPKLFFQKLFPPKKNSISRLHLLRLRRGKEVNIFCDTNANQKRACVQRSTGYHTRTPSGVPRRRDVARESSTGTPTETPFPRRTGGVAHAHRGDPKNYFFFHGGYGTLFGTRGRGKAVTRLCYDTVTPQALPPPPTTGGQSSLQQYKQGRGKKRDTQTHTHERRTMGGKSFDPLGNSLSKSLASIVYNRPEAPPKGWLQGGNKGGGGGAAAAAARGGASSACGGRGTTPRQPKHIQLTTPVWST